MEPELNVTNLRVTFIVYAEYLSHVEVIYQIDSLMSKRVRIIFAGYIDGVNSSNIEICSQYSNIKSVYFTIRSSRFDKCG